MPAFKAIVHTVSPQFDQCELTYLKRRPIDLERAVRQHDTYCNLIESEGGEGVRLNANRDFPDACFVEDTAIVFDELAVMASMGTPARAGEVEAIEAELVKHRRIVRIKPPAKLEGGDVVVISNSVFVGIGPRTNHAGFEALGHLLRHFDYEVTPVNISGCLHLKSACTAISGRSLLVNPDWVDISPFEDYNLITVDESEPWAANVFRLEDKVCLHSGFPRTIKMLKELEYDLLTLDISEFLKAEGGLSCLSLRLSQ